MKHLSICDLELALREQSKALFHLLFACCSVLKERLLFHLSLIFSDVLLPAGTLSVRLCPSWNQLIKVDPRSSHMVSKQFTWVIVFRDFVKWAARKQIDTAHQNPSLLCKRSCMGNPYTGDDARVLSLAGFPHLCSFPVEGIRKALRHVKESSEKKSKSVASSS